MKNIGVERKIAEKEGGGFTHAIKKKRSRPAKWLRPFQKKD